MVTTDTNTLHFHMEPKGNFKGSCQDYTAVEVEQMVLRDGRNIISDADMLSDPFHGNVTVEIRSYMYPMGCPKGIIVGGGYFGTYQPTVCWLEMCHCGNRAEAATGRCLTCQPVDQITPDCFTCRVDVTTQQYGSQAERLGGS
jgi:hypothetical protein